MKSQRLLSLIGISAFLLLSSFCVPYIWVLGYVQYSSENVTKKELLNLNLDDIKDTSDQAINYARITYFRASIKTDTSTRWKRIETPYLPELTVQDCYDNWIDTVLPKLNLRDTLQLTFSLDRATGSNKEELFYFGGYGRYRLQQTFVLSTQNVVDLKRNSGAQAIVAYPSPASDVVSVKLDVKEPVAGHLQVVNGMGQEVASVDHQDLTKPCSFNIQSQPAGTYFVRVQMDGEFFVTKFVKE